jgi:predicted O-methyltransferase YrrM
MDETLWKAVDDYVDGLLIEPDAVLVEVLERSRAAGLPAINVSAPQGKLLYLLVQSLAARRVLEIGTLGAYSTIWMARGLSPGGRLVTIEVDLAAAAVARANIADAGLATTIDLRVGRALDELPKIAAEKRGPFDLVFIDADKPSTPQYLEWALRLSRVGSLIIIDNVVRNGAVSDPESEDASVQGVRRALAALADDQRIVATALQTVGSKGYDGLALALVTGS